MDNAKERAEGTLDDMKGRGESAVGNLTGDKKQQGQGQLDQAKGKGEQGLADAKDKLGDAADKLKGNKDN